MTLQMPLYDLISPDAILPHLQAATKKQALQDMSDRAGLVSGLPSREIFDTLLQRERLGATGVGSGIAIPHGKMTKARHIFGVFAKLDRPIEFDSPDNVPVDLIFMIIAPETAGADHLKALSRIARVLRDPGLTAKMRNARDAASLYALMSIGATSNAA